MDEKSKILIKELTASSKLEEALELFNKATKDNANINNKVAQISARYRSLKEHEIQATLSDQEISIEKNKITKSIFDLLAFENKASSKRRFSSIKIGIIGAVLLVLIMLSAYLFLSSHQKVITGRVYMIEDGIERPIQGCLIKVVNTSGGISETSDVNGQFNLIISGQNRKELEFKLNHPNFEYLAEKVVINFRTRGDTIFSKEFELKPKKRTIDKAFLEERFNLYTETAQVLGYLTSQTDFRSEEYKAKKDRFWELYNVELSAVETKEVESQMVVIGRIIDQINDDLNEEQFGLIKDDLFREAYDLAQIFKKERSNSQNLTSH